MEEFRNLDYPLYPIEAGEKNKAGRICPHLIAAAGAAIVPQYIDLRFAARGRSPPRNKMSLLGVKRRGKGVPVTQYLVFSVSVYRETTLGSIHGHVDAKLSLPFLQSPRSFRHDKQSK